MKFEMKKRILALALAGTTAFSVFGAAMSANAATVYWNGSNSSHETSGDSYYYQSYVPAGDISWSSSTTPSTEVHIDLDVYSPSNLTGGVAVPEGTKLYVTPGTTVPENLKSFITTLKTGDGVYFADLDAFMQANGYTVYTTDATGTFKFGTDDCYLLIKDSGDTAVFETVSKTYWDAHKTELTNRGWSRHQAEQHIYGMGTGYTDEKTVLTNYSFAITPEAFTGHADLNRSWTNAVENVLKSYNGNYYIAGGDKANVQNYTDMIFYKDQSNGGPADVVVTTVKQGTDTTVRTTAGYTILDPTGVSDVETILANPVASTGVVYLYDYAANLVNVTPDEFARAWGTDSLPTLMGATKSLTYENGMGTTYSIRRDVIDEFEAFLEDIGVRDYGVITGDSYVTAWAKDTIDNYAYQYYNDWLSLVSAMIIPLDS